MTDQFAEWDRYMELIEETNTPERAMRYYKKEKNLRELDAYERDLKRDKAAGNTK
jgi:hypothetical protein